MQNSKKTSCFPCVLSTIYCLLLLFLGCGNNRHAVIAVTGTNIGVEISQNPANQTPQAKLGYQRSEIAIVPSNRSGDVEPGSAKGGAADVADVLMELNYRNIFSFTNAGIYQRLAVGKTAVSQPGAALMFAKNERGEIKPEVAEAIKKALGSIPETPLAVSKAINPLTEAYAQMPEKRNLFDNAAKVLNYADFDDFVFHCTSLEQVNRFRQMVEQDEDIKRKLKELESK